VTQNHKQIVNLLNGVDYVDANFLQATGDLVHQSSNNFKHDKIDELRCHFQDAVQQLQSLHQPAESQRVIPCSASTTKGIISENTITTVSLSMNLVEHTPASLTLLESGALYLMTFSSHIAHLAEYTASWMQSKQWRISTIFDDCDADRLKECIVQ